MYLCVVSMCDICVSLFWEGVFVLLIVPSKSFQPLNPVAVYVSLHSPLGWLVVVGSDCFNGQAPS